jgi:hypothetical protein
MEQVVELQLLPQSGRFDALDDRWLEQVGEFTRELADEVGGVSQARQPSPGTKGGVSDILLAVASSGMAVSLLEFAKAWLQRDSTRSLKLSWSDGGELNHVELTGGIDEATVHQVLQSVSQRLAGST